MRISVQVSGYYDWAPCPPGTEITQADIQALRVKQMADDTWHMRVERAAGPGHHHDVGIPEEAICRRMAALARIGRPKSRSQVATELFESSMQHHLDAEHVTGVSVDDDGPVAPAYLTALAEVGVPDADHERLLAGYLAPRDIQKILAASLGVAS